MYQYIYIILLIAVVANATKLPSYFMKCSRTDPKLNECLTQSAKAAWPSMIEGDTSSHIQNMNPFIVSFLHVNVDNNIIGNLSNAAFRGYKEMEINELNLDFDNQTLDIKVFFPKLNFEGDYKIFGRLLFLHIEGEGTTNITFLNMENTIHIKFDLKEISNNQYIEIKESTMNYTTTRGFFRLENLFGGHTRYGETVNNILDENWEAVNEEVATRFGEAMGAVYGEALQSFFRKIPLEEMFFN